MENFFLVEKDIKLINLININELKDKEIKAVEKEGVSLVVLYNEGEASVFEGVCPHQGAFLAEGHIEENQIVCPAHQWKFDCISGKRINGNKKACLKKFNTIIKKDCVCIDYNEFHDWKTSKKSSNNRDTEVVELRTISNLQGPVNYPLINNTLEVFLNAKRIPQLFEKWELKYGKIYKINLFGKENLVVSDPVFAKQIFKARPHIFRNIKEAELLTKEMGLNGISTADGDLWKQYRSLVTTSFTNKDVNMFFPELQKIVTRLYICWKSRIKTENGSFDIRKDLKKFTIDVISSMAFGEEIDTLLDKNQDIHRYLDTIFNMIGYRLTSFFPYWRYVKLPRDYKLEKSISEMKSFVDDYIDKARKKIQLQPELIKKPSNFLEALLSAKTKNGTPLKDEEIYANLISILIGGEDTTANTISWAIYYLMEFPEMQKKIQQEIDEVVGEDTFVNSIGQLHQLSYLDMFLKEVLRLKPVIPLVLLSANQDTVVKDIIVPKGTILHVFTSFRNNEADFEKSREFDPYRWNPKIKSKKSSLESFMPFGSGARSCPFRSLALMEVKTVISMICRNFTITKPEHSKPVEEVYLATVNPENLLVNFQNRK